MNKISTFDLFLEVLEVVSNAITELLGMLPNPDPFPEMIQDLQISPIDSLTIAYYWLDQFFIADAVFTMISLWFLMFPLAWVIMMLWKWIKVR